MDQQHYVGLDVSLDTTSICVIAVTAQSFGGASAPRNPMPFAGPSALRLQPSCE
jgi:hypothetical protein